MANSLLVKEKQIKVGDTVKISYKFKDGAKEKSQIFQGIVIACRGKEDNKSFTVRKVTKEKIGVERIFPANSPFIEKIETIKTGRAQRAKIYFIRGLSDKVLAEKIG